MFAQHLDVMGQDMLMDDSHLTEGTYNRTVAHFVYVRLFLMPQVAVLIQSSLMEHSFPFPPSLVIVLSVCA